MKKLILIALPLAFICLAILPGLALASQFGQGLNNVATASGFTQVTVEAYAAGIIKTLLTLVGIIFVILLIYGGFLYMTSQGEKDKTKKGKDAIIAAVVGLVIIISGYSITYFIANQVQNPGAVQPAFNANYEDSGSQDYNSVNACNYRYGRGEYNTITGCCGQTGFVGNGTVYCPGK